MHSFGCNTVAVVAAVVAGTGVGVQCVPFDTELGCQTVALAIGILVGLGIGLVNWTLTKDCPEYWPFDQHFRDR